jgi:Uma2 family endonuclease
MAGSLWKEHEFGTRRRVVTVARAARRIVRLPTGFTLPDGAIMSPHGSWVRRERWDALTKEEQEGFAPICPDFVVELRSTSDSMSRLQNKMQEYIKNRALLAWLIDPLKRQVDIYRPGRDVEVLTDPEMVSG